MCTHYERLIRQHPSMGLSYEYTTLKKEKKINSNNNKKSSLTHK